MKRISVAGSNDPAFASMNGVIHTFGSGTDIFLNDS
jgi:hypothetical protein